MDTDKIDIGRPYSDGTVNQRVGDDEEREKAKERIREQKIKEDGERKRREEQKNQRS